jgi:hypothetical protein
LLSTSTLKKVCLGENDFETFKLGLEGKMKLPCDKYYEKSIILRASLRVRYFKTFTDKRKGHFVSYISVTFSKD